MRAALVQIAGLVVAVTCASFIALLAGGVAAGVALVFVGLAMERD